MTLHRSINGHRRSLAANEIDSLHKALRTEEIGSVANPTKPNEAAHDKEETENLTREISDWPHALVAIDERRTNRVELCVLTIVVKGNGNVVILSAITRIIEVDYVYTFV